MLILFITAHVAPCSLDYGRCPLCKSSVFCSLLTVRYVYSYNIGIKRPKVTVSSWAYFPGVHSELFGSGLPWSSSIWWCGFIFSLSWSAVHVFYKGITSSWLLGKPRSQWVFLAYHRSEYWVVYPIEVKIIPTVCWWNTPYSQHSQWFIVKEPVYYHFGESLQFLNPRNPVHQIQTRYPTLSHVTCILGL